MPLLDQVISLSAYYASEQAALSTKPLSYTSFAAQRKADPPLNDGRMPAHEISETTLHAKLTRPLDHEASAFSRREKNDGAPTDRGTLISSGKRVPYTPISTTDSAMTTPTTDSPPNKPEATTNPDSSLRARICSRLGASSAPIAISCSRARRCRALQMAS